MAVIGFLACVIVMVLISIPAALTAANSLGAYTIGGVPNTILDKLGALLLLVGVVCGWLLLAHFAPFTISFKG